MTNDRISVAIGGVSHTHTHTHTDDLRVYIPTVTMKRVSNIYANVFRLLYYNNYSLLTVYIHGHLTENDWSVSQWRHQSEHT